MAYIVVAYIVMAYTVMAYIVMTDIVMACIIMAKKKGATQARLRSLYPARAPEPAGDVGLRRHADPGRRATGQGPAPTSVGPNSPKVKLFGICSVYQA